MKKILSLAACTAMVLGFAATASAVHMEAPAETSPVVAKGGLIHIDGSVRMRGTVETEGLTDSSDNSQAFYDGRARIGVQVQTSDAISGYINLENGDDFGNVPGLSNDFYVWGEDGAAPNSLFDGGAKHTGLNILEAWINYMPSNWGVKVGHMPLALGNKLFFDHTGYGDDAIVAYMNPNDATHLGVLTFKGLEQSLAASTDDVDVYVAFATYKMSDVLNLGANYTLIHAGSEVTGVTDSAKFSNLGVTVDGKIGPVSYGLDGEFQFGDSIFSVTNGELDKAKGMAFMGKANMDLGPANVGVLVGYGTGDDDFTDGDDKTFTNFLTQDIDYFTLIVGDHQPVPSSNVASVFSNSSGLANMFLVQVNGAMATKCPLTGKDLNLKATVSYMKLNKVIDPMDDSLGTEIDLFADWQLGNGLVYGVEAGYLVTGDAYKDYYAAGDASNGYFLRHRLELTF